MTTQTVRCIQLQRLAISKSWKNFNSSNQQHHAYIKEDTTNIGLRAKLTCQREHTSPQSLKYAAIALGCLQLLLV